ncbi:MAG: CoA pyrophosphatase [Desulfobacterales bacterium]
MFTDHVHGVLDQSAVLVPIGPNCINSEEPADLCLILNKRSKNVRQAGDLCFPGGGVSPNLDRLLANLLKFPLTPLTRWKFWTRCRKRSPAQAYKLSILFAASLRESFEEMRVNPLHVRFLGTLNPYRLAMQNRFIFPMVGWLPKQKRFLHNWEVEKIVYIPVRRLLNPENHAMFKLSIAGNQASSLNRFPLLHPGYLHESEGEIDLLWGATYRIAMDFLSVIFDYNPPPPNRSATIDWVLDENYFNGTPRFKKVSIRK